MSNFQEWCVKVLPLIQAAANGEVVQARPVKHVDERWDDIASFPMCFPVTTMDFDNYDYRIKPRTIMIGDIEVPEPMRKPPQDGAWVWYVDVSKREAVFSIEWLGAGWQHTLLERGLAHWEQSDAHAYAKALIALTAKKDASHE